MSTNINLNKLPEITLAFWVMKICATTLGETAGDLLSMTLNVGYAMSSLILISAFALLELDRALWSILAGVVLNQVLSMNHRPGRYVVV